MMLFVGGKRLKVGNLVCKEYVSVCSKLFAAVNLQRKCNAGIETYLCRKRSDVKVRKETRDDEY